MRLLLDTHAFVWWDSDQASLSRRALMECLDPENELFLSIVSVWEMQIKSQIGKLSLRLPLRDLVEDHRRRGMQIASVEVEDVLGLAALPMIHRDRFDRLARLTGPARWLPVRQPRSSDRRLRRGDPLVNRQRRGRHFFQVPGDTLGGGTFRRIALILKFPDASLA